MVMLTYERDGRQWSEEFPSLNECCHSAALRSAEGSGKPTEIVADDGRRWRGDELKALLDQTARRHGWD